MRRASRLSVLSLSTLLIAAGAARADGPASTPGYPEPVVQWGVQKDETCEDVAKAVYGSAKHAALVLRYNRVDCTRGKKLKEGQTLVLPASVTSLPTARLKSIHPDVKSKPSGGSWGPASAGQALSSSAGVNTLDEGRADIEFIDRTRVFLASNTLVIIYGTASQSAVSKTPPPAVEVQAGEVMAGLAALRGETVEVAVQGGGRVSASSRETIVERKGERTTVGVYDGKADVSSGGKTVNVPLNHGTRFTGATPPAPPRPLPPAPAWGATTSLFVIASAEGGQIKAEWDEVKDARSYRVEVARDEAFRDLVAREEVAATVRSFRADKMPPGRYHVAVRAIDKDEYLGVAAKRAVDVVQIDVGASGAAAAPGELSTSPYAVLAMKATTKMELAIDDGPFGPMPATLDLAKRAPSRLRFRPEGAAAPYEVTVKYTEVTATVNAPISSGGGQANVEVTFGGVDGIDVAGRVAPVLRITQGGSASQVPLALKDGRWIATVTAPPEGGSMRVDVLDGRGAILGTGNVTRPKPPPPAPVVLLVKIPALGFTTETTQPSPVTGVPFWSPTARNAASAAVQTQIGGGGAGFRMQGTATGALGPFGVDATIRSQLLGHVDGPDDSHDDAAWLGVRARFLRVDWGHLEAGVAARFGFPVGELGPGERLEVAGALGGAAGSFTWLLNAGVRARVGEGAAVPDDQIFLLAGGTTGWGDWLRAGLVVDAHVVRPPSGDADLRGGLSAQVEAGTSVYGALSLRLSPWEDDTTGFRDGLFSAQLALGLRAY
jgi:hypothetical protein